MWIIAKPVDGIHADQIVVDENGHDECQPLLLHRTIFSDKQAMYYQHENGIDGLDEEVWSTHELGTYTFDVISQAYDATSISDEEYDVVLNNCGDFIIEFASKLGLTTTSEMSWWTAEQLLKHSNGELSDYIRSSPNIESSISGLHLTDEMSDIEIVYHVIDRKARAIYHDNDNGENDENEKNDTINDDEE